MSTRDFETGNLEKSNYINSPDPAIKAGATGKPELIFQYIGKRKFSDLLMAYTLGYRVCELNIQAKNIRRRYNKTAIARRKTLDDID